MVGSKLLVRHVSSPPPTYFESYFDCMSASFFLRDGVQSASVLQRPLRPAANAWRAGSLCGSRASLPYWSPLGWVKGRVVHPNWIFGAMTLRRLVERRDTTRKLLQQHWNIISERVIIIFDAFPDGYQRSFRSRWLLIPYSMAEWSAMLFCAPPILALLINCFGF